MTIDLLMKHVTEAVKMHLGFLEINDVEGGFIMPHEINDGEVTYRLVIKRTTNNLAVATLKSTGEREAVFTQSIGSGCTSTSDFDKRCPRCKTSEKGCEFFDNGICRGVVYPTMPPQYDPCVFTTKLEVRQ